MLYSRYRRILFFSARVIVNSIIWDLIFPRIGLKSYSKKTRQDRFVKYAISFRNMAIDMGGVLIKVGQFLSTRFDILPDEVTVQLSNLQDEVPPVPFSKIKEIVEKELGDSLGDLFTTFNPIPLAAASLGQVHEAQIYPPFKTEKGHVIENVVVKAQRPNIERIIQTDLSAISKVGRLLHYYGPIRRRVNLPSLIHEFSDILYEEIDYLLEGKNAEKFSLNFSHRREIRVPSVIWNLTTRHVITLENVQAIKITNYEMISQAGINRSEVASILLDTYLQQIFEDGFFHADPHPGNLFVQPLSSEYENDSLIKESWKLVFIDFGMVGTVSSNVKNGLRELLMGVGTKNIQRVIQSFETLGVLLPSADTKLLEKAGNELFEQFWGKNMTELFEISQDEILDYIKEFREIIYTFPFQIPQNLIFLGRTVGILSGMCTGLDPKFNVWDHLAPFAKK